MVRSAAAALAVLILPSFASAQEPVGTHSVVREDTLWDLAQRYYSNPFEWRVIWNANRDVVEDPNWIYPAEVLVIPGLPGEAPADEPEPQEDMVEGVPTDMVPFGLRQARPVSEQARTVFYRDAEQERAMLEESAVRDYAPVSSDAVYSAPWLIGLEGDPENEGAISGFADRGSRSTSIRNLSLIHI